jgi:hypothetical protein
VTQTPIMIPVDGRTADWPRKVATVLNRLQNTTAAAGVTATWGAIAGTLSDQTDLTLALGSKQNLLVSGTNIKTVNGSSLLGSGNLAVGTVTSVAASVPTGFSIAGSPITGSGTLAITFTAGYSLPTDASQTNWNTAFGWGNHASAGYLTTSAAAAAYQPLDADLTAIAALSGTNTIYYRSAANTWSAVTVSTGLSFSGGALTNTVTAPTAANPTATASDTAVNGSAGTFMRSDAAPAIQKASSSVFGLVKVDGTTITASGGVISAVGGGGGAMTKLATFTASGSTATASFTSISGSYSALKIVGIARCSTAGTGASVLRMRFNADTGTNYAVQTSVSNGTSTNTFGVNATAQTGTQVAEINNAGTVTNAASTFEAIIPFYADTTFAKQSIGMYNTWSSAATSSQYFINQAGFWNNTAAITQIDFVLPANFVAGSKIILYGIS